MPRRWCHLHPLIQIIPKHFLGFLTKIYNILIATFANDTHGAIVKIQI